MKTGPVTYKLQARMLDGGEEFHDGENWNLMEEFLNRRLSQQEAAGKSRRDPIVTEDPRSSQDSRPEDFILESAYPNPFNPVTVIPFELPENSRVRLEIYDLLGRHVAVLTDQGYEAGRHEITWNASNASSGVYVVRMTVSTEQGVHNQFNQQITLVK